MRRWRKNDRQLLLVEAGNNQNRSNNETVSKLAKIAGVGKEIYRMGAKVLNSDNEDVKNRVLSGETSISAGYNKNYGYQLLFNKKFCR